MLRYPSNEDRKTVGRCSNDHTQQRYYTEVISGEHKEIQPRDEWSTGIYVCFSFIPWSLWKFSTTRKKEITWLKPDDEH